FRLTMDDGMVITVDETALKNAGPNVADQLDPAKAVDVKIAYDEAKTHFVTVRCVAVPSSTPQAKMAREKLSTTTLWSKVEMYMGGRAGFREIVGGGFELLDPALGALDDFAFVPQPVAAFELAARLVRDQLLLDVGPLKERLVAVQVNDTDAPGTKAVSD